MPIMNLSYFFWGIAWEYFLWELNEEGLETFRFRVGWYIFFVSTIQHWSVYRFSMLLTIGLCQIIPPDVGSMLLICLAEAVYTITRQLRSDLKHHLRYPNLDALRSIGQMVSALYTLAMDSVIFYKPLRRTLAVTLFTC
jgi:hypothetical protein